MIPEEKIPAKRNRIVWSEQEWDFVATLVWKMRLSRPTEPFSRTIIAAQKQLPEDRRKLLTDWQPLIERVIKLNKEMEQKAETVDSLTQHAESLPTPEQVLSGLSDYELMKRYKDRFFRTILLEEIVAGYDTEKLLEHVSDEELVALAGRRLVRLMARSKEPAFLVASEQPHKQYHPQESTQRLPKVVIVGALPGQQTILRTDLAEVASVVFIESDGNKPIPKNADLYVLWIKFIGHHKQREVENVASREKIIRFGGGITEMIIAIKNFLHNLANK